MRNGSVGTAGSHGLGLSVIPAMIGPRGTTGIRPMARATTVFLLSLWASSGCANWVVVDHPIVLKSGTRVVEHFELPKNDASYRVALAVPSSPLVWKWLNLAIDDPSTAPIRLSWAVTRDGDLVKEHTPLYHVSRNQDYLNIWLTTLRGDGRRYRVEFEIQQVAPGYEDIHGALGVVRN